MNYTPLPATNPASSWKALVPQLAAYPVFPLCNKVPRDPQTGGPLGDWQNHRFAIADVVNAHPSIDACGVRTGPDACNLISFDLDGQTGIDKAIQDGCDHTKEATWKIKRDDVADRLKVNFHTTADQSARLLEAAGGKPFKKSVDTKPKTEANKKEAIEVFFGVGQIAAIGHHPDGGNYIWEGSPQVCAELPEAWFQLALKIVQGTRRKRRTPPKPRPSRAAQPMPSVVGQADPDELALATAAINAIPISSTGNDDWVGILFALADVDPGLRGLAHQWSSTEGRYNPGRIDHIFDNATKGAGSSIATLIYHAKKHCPSFLADLRRTNNAAYQWWDDNRRNYTPSGITPIWHRSTGTDIGDGFWPKWAAQLIFKHYNATSGHSDEHYKALVLLVLLPPGWGKSSESGSLSDHIIGHIPERRVILTAPTWRDPTADQPRVEYRERTVRHPVMVRDQGSGIEVQSKRGPVSETAVLTRPANCRIFHSIIEIQDQISADFSPCDICQHRATCNYPGRIDADVIAWKEGATHDDRNWRCAPEAVAAMIRELTPPERRETVVAFDEFSSLQRALISVTEIDWSTIDRWRNFMGRPDIDTYLTPEQQLQVWRFLSTLGHLEQQVTRTDSQTPAPERYGFTPDRVYEQLRDAAQTVGTLDWLTELALDPTLITDSDDGQQVLLDSPFLLSTLLAAAQSTTTPLTVTDGGIRLRSYRTDVRDTLLSACSVVVLDATTSNDKVQQILNIGLEPDDQPSFETLTVNYEAAITDTLQIHQVPWFGVMSPNQEREGETSATLHLMLDAIQRHFDIKFWLESFTDTPSRSAQMGYIDGKKHVTAYLDSDKSTKLPTLAYFSGSRGSNRLADCEAVVLAGLPMLNMTETTGLYSLLHQKLVGIEDEDFQEFYRRSIGEETIQAIFRTRPLNAKPGQARHAVVITNADFSEMPPYLQPIQADWLPYEFKGTHGQTIAKVGAALDGMSVTTTQAVLAERIQAAEKTLTRALGEFGLTLDDVMHHYYPWHFEHQHPASLRLSLRINARSRSKGKVTGGDVAKRMKAVETAAEGGEILQAHHKAHGGELTVTYTQGPALPPSTTWAPPNQPLRLDLRLLGPY